MSLSMTKTAEIQALFNDKASLPERLHHIMAHHEHGGDLNKLNQAVDLVARLGKLSFNQPCRDEKWTPMEVAVLSGYELGITCLLQKGIEPGPRAFELAQIHHPDLLPLLGSLKAAPAEEKKSAKKDVIPMKPHSIRPFQSTVL